MLLPPDRWTMAIRNGGTDLAREFRRRRPRGPLVKVRGSARADSGSQSDTPRAIVAPYPSNIRPVDIDSYQLSNIHQTTGSSRRYKCSTTIGLNSREPQEYRRWASEKVLLHERLLNSSR